MALYTIGTMNIHLTKSQKRNTFYNLICNIVKLDICAVVETKFQEGQGERYMRETLDRKEYSWYGRDRRKW
jgi:hypothetical protein